MKIKGLNIRRNKVGKWYVSLRATGKVLLSAKCDRDKLDALMEEPAFLLAYATAERKRVREYAAGTLGALAERYRAGRSFNALAPRTRADYIKVLQFLDQWADYRADDIETSDIVEVRDEAAAKRGDVFSGFVIAVLSNIFREAIEAGLIKSNMAKGVRRLYRVDDAANRRWTDDEWQTAYSIIPAHLRAVLAIAKHCGLRGQDIAVLTWENYRNDPDMGKVLAFVPAKNGKKVGELTISVPDQLRSVLDAMKAGDGVVQPAINGPICRNSLGKKYPTENAMRKAWQDFKASDAYASAFDSGRLNEEGEDIGVMIARELTLHGLRVTFSSELREQGFSDREVADMLGDLSEGMGKRYSRGAEMRKTSVRVHKKRVQNAS